jgi:hypothetical protein
MMVVSEKMECLPLLKNQQGVKRCVLEQCFSEGEKHAATGPESGLP